LAQDSVSLALMPSGNGWPEAQAAMIELRYQDGDYCVDETLPLTASGALAVWRVPIYAAGPRTLSARTHVSYRDGRFESRAWAELEPGVLAVRIEAAQRRELRVLPIVFDLQRVREAQVNVRAGEQQHTLVVCSRAGATLIMARGRYSWSCTWVRADGSRVELPGDERDTDVLVLPPPA
jgi:hypothetical protein